jgi:hypothetical protein
MRPGLRSTALVVGGALAVLVTASVASIPICPFVPSYGACAVIPLCAAVRIEQSGPGPIWRCHSRFRR